MMRKKALAMKEQTRRVTLDFSLKDNKNFSVVEAVNVDCRGGYLRSAPSAEQLKTSAGAVRFCSLQKVITLAKIPYYVESNGKYQANYCAVTSNGDFYLQIGESASFELSLMNFPAVSMTLYAGTDLLPKLVIAACRDGIFLVDAYRNMKKFAYIYVLPVVAFFKHRLFVGLEKGGILYSAPEDVLNFTENLSDAGKLYFPAVGGQIVAMKSFDGYLYVFFEKGILRLDIAGDPKDFVAKEIEYGGGTIFGRTVCVCGESIIFMASDGVYRFDGKRAERLFADFVKMPQMQTGTEGCAVWQDRAMICYQTDDGKETLVVYADGKDCYYMSGLTALSCEDGACALFLDKDGAICRLSDGEGTLLDNGIYTVKTDFGIAGYKTLRKLCFEGEGTFALTVRSNKRIFKREVAFADGVAEVALAERGEEFLLSFTPTSKLMIRSAKAELRTA